MSSVFNEKNIHTTITPDTPGLYVYKPSPTRTSLIKLFTNTKRETITTDLHCYENFKLYNNTSVLNEGISTYKNDKP